MSRNRYDWWGYVKGMIRRYPRLHMEHAALHEAPTTAQLSGTPGGGQISDPTAAAALRELPPVKQREHDAVKEAIRQTHLRAGADVRLKVVELVFWKRSHTLAGAAMEIGISERTARRYHTDFIYLVARNFGLL